MCQAPMHAFLGQAHDRTLDLDKSGLAMKHIQSRTSCTNGHLKRFCGMFTRVQLRKDFASYLGRQGATDQNAPTQFGGRHTTEH